MDFLAGLAASQEELGGATVELMVARVCVDEWMRKKRASSLYRPEAGDGRGTRGVAIAALAEVGGRRSAGEASPLTWRRLPKRCSGTVGDASEKTHQGRVAARRAR
jgi:hypothetical protein